MFDDRFVFLRSDIPDEIYHYTNTKAALSILENNTIRLTSLLFMNDSSELLYAFKVVCRILNEHIKSLQGMDDLHTNIKRSTYEKVLKHLGNVLRGKVNVKEDPRSHIYSASFCCESDLLSQWRSYCSTEGLAIAFNRSFVESVDQKFRSKYVLVCNKCLYVEKEFIAKVEAAIKHVSGMLEQLQGAALDFVLLDSKYTRKPPVAFDHDLKSFLLSLCCLFKHERFKEEAEFRIAIIGGAVDTFSGKFGKPNFYDANGILKPYHNLNFENEHVKSILIKPSENVSQIVKSVRLYLDSNRDKYSLVKVIKSKIPYRG